MVWYSEAVIYHPNTWCLLAYQLCWYRFLTSERMVDLTHAKSPARTWENVIKTKE
jgi:hypothetical protein